MARGVRIAVLCIGPPGAAGAHWAPADVQHLIRPSPPAVPAADRCTVGDFWLDHGGHDLSPSTALPRLELARDAPAWAALEACTEDGTPGDRLARSLQGLVDTVPMPFRADLVAADAILVVASAGSPLAWSQHVQVGPGAYRPCAHVPQDVTHTTLTHEIGHLLGYGHSHGLPTEHFGSEYGDPYCIMSARRFGGRTAQVTRATTGPGLRPGAPLWSMVGPGLAQATVWAHRPHWPAAGQGVRVLSWPEHPHPVTVAHPALPAGDRPRLLAVPTHDGARWITVEVRGPLPDGVEGPDWDAAFHLDREPGTSRPADSDPQDAPGLVVHELELLDGAPRVTYRGTVALPLSGDTDLCVGDEPGRLTVRATGYSAGVATLLVGSGGAVPMAWARVEPEPGRTVVHALTTGYTEPVFTWRLDGEPVAARARLGETHFRLDPRVEVLWDRLVLHAPDPAGISIEVEVHEGAEPGRTESGRTESGRTESGRTESGRAGPVEPRRSEVAVDSAGVGVRVRCSAW